MNTGKSRAPEFTTKCPSEEEYCNLRSAAGWGNISMANAKRSLAATAICICARDNHRIVGFGRAVGDGLLYFYVSDVFVHPEQRGTGLGAEISRRLLLEIDKQALPGATVAVVAAPGRERFYEKIGFTSCPNEFFGGGLVYLKPIRKMISG
ncbi:MAG: GNAT family N-acetyltransferase [Pseudomonadota bacterium]